MNNLKAERTLTAEELAKLIVTATTAAQEIWWMDDVVSALSELQRLRSQSLSTQQPMGEVGVKALEWEAVTDQIPKHAYAAYTPFSRLLIVCEFLSMNHMVYRFNGVDFETLDEAQAAAQSDYDARILSALHPNQESGE